MEKRAAGICLGASSVKLVVVEQSGMDTRIIDTAVRNHDCDPAGAFSDLTQGSLLSSCEYAAVTGGKYRELVTTPGIPEAQAIEYAAALAAKTEVGQKAMTVLSLGAESFAAYGIDSTASVASVESGNKCASGTGEFLAQQIRRMGLDFDKAQEQASGCEPFLVSGRCSVFCKSDCTHAINKGTSAGRVLAGLFKMVADRALELLEKVRLDNNPVLAVGGVTKNRVIMEMIREKIPELLIPVHAEYFEALGAALYALENAVPLKIGSTTVSSGKNSFALLPPISAAQSRVRFEEVSRATASAGEGTIVGLDVGSTTTKAVAIRKSDAALLASVYLRTNGDPIGASRACYGELTRQLNLPVGVVGIGVTGSGRRLAGIHAQTDQVINEIIAHATAAAWFDPTVDTILEIGGQDAKYTFLTNGVPSDYAMNEACSAGTGSFLEESAHQALGVPCAEIEPIALSSNNPRNFSDQCAAFISSDIDSAVREGVGREDIIAGLVYSVCMNYVNKVRGRRTVGSRIFMQGGVCYNKAVPLAMANLLERDIVVPPEPGLMGAYGVALEVRNRMQSGQCTPGSWELRELANRGFERGKSFICRGDGEGCDRRCEIDMIVVNGKRHPFGGACNRYENSFDRVSHPDAVDYVRVRNSIIFADRTAQPGHDAPTVGINRSFLTHLLFPMFSTFFRELGIKVVLSDTIDVEGVRRARTSFCYPVEIAHGALNNLLAKKPDFVFLPSIIELHIQQEGIPKREHQCTCVLLQSEPYYLKSAFRDDMSHTRVLSPVFNFAHGYDSQGQVFRELARQCGLSDQQADTASQKAIQAQMNALGEMKKRGKQILESLERDKGRIAIVLMGRPYNAFAPEANPAIPQKFTSRGVAVIPWDFLPYEPEECGHNMCWAMGQNMIRVSRFVARHPNLYPVYITNFSCGPDSFLVGHFREIMGSKPSLTLELDGHTADAGITTRVEAFLDIIERSRSLPRRITAQPQFNPAQVVQRGKRYVVIASDGKEYGLDHPRVHLLLPSLGELASDFFASAFRSMGIRTTAMPVYDAQALSLGRGNTSGKECVPLILTAGGLLSYLRNRTDSDEILVYFMPTCGGNCRFTQYTVFLNRLIEKHRLQNVALLSLNNESGYSGLPWTGQENLLKAILVADVMDDIQNALTVLACDKEEAQALFNKQSEQLKGIIAAGGSGLWAGLEAAARELSTIKLVSPLHGAPTVTLTGEIFSRRDDFLCREIIERLSASGIVVKRTPILEWLAYCDYNVKHGYYQSDFGLAGWVEFGAKRMMRWFWERRIKRILARSGLFEFEQVDIEGAMQRARHFFDPTFTGESQLVVGSFYKDILHSVHGVISIGPFACMHTRVADAVLAAEATVGTKRRIDPGSADLAGAQPESRLPFLTVECDGNPLPQIIQARIEAFCLQVLRVHRLMDGRSHSQTSAIKPPRKTSWVPSVQTALVLTPDSAEIEEDRRKQQCVDQSVVHR